METKIFAESGSITSLFKRMESFAPEFCRVAVLGGDGEREEAYVRELSRHYRTVRPTKEEFAAGGVRAIVAIDREDEGKYLAARLSLPLVLVLTRPCSPLALMPVCKIAKRGGYRERLSAVKPTVLSCDYDILSSDERDAACGYGRIAATVSALFELRAETAINGSEAVRGYSAAVTSALKELFAAKKPSPLLVTELSLRLARETSRFNVYPKGAYEGFCEALRLQGSPLTEGEAELLSALLVTRTYVAFLAYFPVRSLKTRSGNAYVDVMAEKLNVSPVFSIERLVSAMPLNELERKLYCLSQSRYELLSLACSAEKTLAFALSGVKRLYKDKGFSYNKYPSKEKATVALATASEPGGGLLSLITELGLLERIL